MTGNFPAVVNFKRLFLKLNRFICNQLPVLPDHRSWVHIMDSLLEKLRISKKTSKHDCLTGTLWRLSLSLGNDELNSPKKPATAASCGWKLNSWGEGQPQWTGRIVHWFQGRCSWLKSQLKTQMQLTCWFSWNVDTGPTQVDTNSLWTRRIVNCGTN